MRVDAAEVERGILDEEQRRVLEQHREDGEVRALAHYSIHVRAAGRDGAADFPPVADTVVPRHTGPHVVGVLAIRARGYRHGDVDGAGANPGVFIPET